MINVLLVFVWFIGITAIPGLSVLSILYKDLKRFEFIELFVLAIGIGISYLVIISYLLDLFLIINIATLVISILPFLGLIILVYNERIYYSVKNIKYNLRNNALRTYLTIKSKFLKVKVSSVLLLLVLCFIVVIELRDLLSNIVLPVNDPWFWLIESKEIAVTGHLQVEFGSADYGYFRRFPRGAAYFLSSMFLPNLANPYYIILFIGPYLSLLQCMGVYVASKKLLNSDKLAIYSVLVYGTSRLVIWRGKIFITESLGLFLIIILAIFLFEKDLKSYILGLFVLSGLGLTSFSSFGPIILPTLLYIVLYKPRKVSAITCAGILGGVILLPTPVRTWMWKSISSITFNPKIFFWDMFYGNAQWTFGYSLAFSFIGAIYCLKNRSSKQMYYLICFLALFIMINFLDFRTAVINTRVFPFFSIFASTLTAQGLWSTIKVIRNALFPIRLRGNIKSYLLHFIVAICIIYQVFFGMARGYHATIGRSHSSEDVAVALWLYDNSHENSVVLVATNDLIPYSSILYPRTVIHNQNVYNFSPVEIVAYCSQNDIDYLILRNDDFSKQISVDNHFTEIYRSANIIVFEFIL